MKFKKIMLITLLLAVLTIGAVSAAEDADVLAVEDAGDEAIAEAPGEDDVASGEDSDTIMDDSGALPDEDYIIGFGSDNITSRDDKICEINDQEGGSNCWASIYANDTLVFDEEIQTGYSYNIYAKELNGTFDGFYNLKVVYTATNGTKWFKEQMNYFNNITGKLELNPADFNVTFADRVLDLGVDKGTTAVRFFVPAYVSDGRVEIRYGEGVYDTEDIYIYSSHTNDFLNVTLRNMGFSNEGVYNLVVSYIDDDENSVELARGVLNVTKNYHADDFMELMGSNIKSVADYIFHVHELNGQRAMGKVSAYYNGSQVFVKTYNGAQACYITGKDIMGYFEGECVFTLVYDREDDGKQYSKNFTINFINPIINKALTPEDFNVTFPNTEITVDDMNKVIITYFVPEGIDEYFAALRVRYGPGTYDYLSISLEMDDINKTKEIKLEDFYIFGPCTLNLEVAYYVGDDKILDIANSTLEVTKVFTPNDFIEVYDKQITDPTDYVCNVYDSYSGLNGEVTVSANGNQVFYRNFVNNAGTALRINGSDLSGDLEGTYTVKVVYKRTADGKEYSKQATITFGSSQPDTRPVIALTPAVDNITYGEDAIVRVTANNTAFSGNVLVEIKNADNVIAKSNVLLTNGVGSATFSNLNASTYTVSLSANDTEEYKFRTESATFTVNKADSALDIDAVIELDAGTPLNIIVKTVNATGISAKIDDGDAAVDGNVIMIPALSMGTYTLKVTTIVDDNHQVATRNVTLNVTMPKSSIVMDKNIVIITGSSANVTVNTTNALGFNATIDGHPDAVSINGNVITISGLGLGTYVLSVTTIVDENHISVTENANVTVKNLDSSIEFTKSSMTFDYGSSDSIGAIVSNGKIGKVVIIGHDEAAINITDNVITVSNLSAGSYVLCVTTDPDENYDAVNGTVPVTVNRVASSLNVSDIAFDYGASGSTTVDFADALGFNASVAGHPGAVAMDGNKITVSGLDAGTYVLSVATIVDANHIAAVKNVTVTVNKLATSIASSAVSAVYKDSKYLVATLKDAQGKAISGAEISTNVKGLNKMATDSNGQVKWLVGSLTPKNYDVVLTFAGNANYVKSTQKVAVKVAKATPKMTAKAKTFKKSVKTKKYSVTLKDNKGKAIKNAKLTLKVKGKTYKATTNAKGVATFKITKLTKKGKHKATVKYAGSAYYKGITKKYTVKVK